MTMRTLKAVALATVVGLAGISGASAFYKFEDVTIPTVQQAEPAALANQFCLSQGFKRQIDFAFLGFGSRAPKAGLQAEYDYVKCSMTATDIFGAGDMNSHGGDRPDDPRDEPTPPSTHPI